MKHFKLNTQSDKDIDSPMKVDVLDNGTTPGSQGTKQNTNMKESASQPSNQMTAKASQENIKASVESFQAKDS